MEQRLATLVERDELSSRAAAAGANLGDRACASDRGHAVAHRAAGAVERRAKPFARAFDFQEIVEPDAELLELDRRHARKRIARHWNARLREEQGARKQNKSTAKSERGLKKRSSVPRRLGLS
jgi:hypothetical protein